MTEIINLRRARKQKQRSAEAANGEANRLLHGRTKEEKNLTKAQRAAEQSKLDAHKLVKQQAEDE